ncbi:hypothetical protein Sango_1746700 [Sesamum angolense]|uniref:Helitron helicase-like domain-containing protein n=1 Tax=Sesamum angolense TaxID=2727404 RepID=A0AAE1WMI4_9LAMI|nr:hypothetical protein Sango_1746700 [Sesamum angolense]
MHCGAIRFHREPPGFCCSNGQVSLSTLDVPEELRDLFFGSSQMALHFKAHSRTYNNVFAFTSFGVTYDKELCRNDKNVYTFRVQGLVYHFLNDLIPRREKQLICNYIFMMLRMSLREIPELHDCRIVLRADPGLDQRIYNIPDVDQVAAIWKDSDELLQQYVNDMYIKVETQRLDYFRHEQRQKNARIESLQGIVDSLGIHGENDPNKIGQRIILPASFIGGPRDMRKRYMDAMTLVQKYGKLDIFLTMTCNPNWTEITNKKLDHELPQNRPDLFARVFRAKLEELKR